MMYCSAGLLAVSCLLISVNTFNNLDPERTVPFYLYGAGIVVMVVAAALDMSDVNAPLGDTDTALHKLTDVARSGRQLLRNLLEDFNCLLPYDGVGDARFFEMTQPPASKLKQGANAWSLSVDMADFVTAVSLSPFSPLAPEQQPAFPWHKILIKVTLLCAAYTVLRLLMSAMSLPNLRMPWNELLLSVGFLGLSCASLMLVLERKV
jgi:hypothetical protein